MCFRFESTRLLLNVHINFQIWIRVCVCVLFEIEWVSCISVYNIHISLPLHIFLLPFYFTSIGIWSKFFNFIRCYLHHSQASSIHWNMLLLYLYCVYCFSFSFSLSYRTHTYCVSFGRKSSCSLSPTLTLFPIYPLLYHSCHLMVGHKNITWFILVG